MNIFDLGFFQRSSTNQPQAQPRTPTTSSITSKLRGAISAPFYGMYYAGKGVYHGAAFTGRTIYTVGRETYTFPQRLRRAELGPMLFTAGGIAAFTLQSSIALTSPAGVAGSILSAYLAANIAYGVAIPAIVVGSSVALFHHFNPGVTKNLCERSIDQLRLNLKVVTPKELAEIKATTKASVEAAKEATLQIAKAETAKMQLEKLQIAGKAAAKPSIASSIYSQFASATGLGLNFTGEGVIAIGESTTEAGLVATRDAFNLDQNQALQLRVASKLTSAALAALATTIIASKTDLSLSYVAAPLLVSAAATSFDLASDNRIESDAHKAMKESELSKIAKTEGPAPKFKKMHAGAALAKGVLFEIVGNTISNLGLSLILHYGGAFLALGSSFASRTLMPSVAANLYGKKDHSSYLDKISLNIQRLVNQGKGAFKLQALAMKSLRSTATNA